MRISDWSSDVCSSDLARGEGREMPAPTDLAGLLRDVVAQMTRDGRTVDLHVEQDLMLPLRREAMRRCLTNLLANAQRHGKHVAVRAGRRKSLRSEEHTSELQSLMRISYAVFSLIKKNNNKK